ncbi:MAG: hypothetical protein QNJ54_34985 [Prochloraceae cyanobacterium]|nr:hypothetical protein [Prochloraceae cyanobacterium]
MMSITSNQNSSPDKSSIETIKETRKRIEASQKQTQLVINLSYFLIAVIFFGLFLEIWQHLSS